MPPFEYTAVDAHGAEHAGHIDASDARQAVTRLRERGLHPTALAPAAAARPAKPSPDPHQRGAGKGLLGGRRVRQQELAVFTRQLGTLLQAGLPLLRALEVLARQERNPALQTVGEALAAAIKSGGTFSEALAQHPRVFEPLYVNMVRAGEAGGVLDVVLGRLAGFQEKSQQLRGKIIAALVYPLIVLAVAGLILSGLLVFVVPRFQQIFADLLKGAPLPPLTRFVLAVSQIVKDHLLPVLAGVVALGVGLNLLRRSPPGARLLDAGLVRLPLGGDLYLKGVIARFGRTLGTLLESGVPILPAMLISRDTCGNVRVAEAITAVHDQVREGAAVARPLESTEVFPPMVTSMIDVGEHTGQLPAMLTKVAEIYEAEVDRAVAGLSALLEPILILFLALVVGTIVIALFLPIVRIVQLLT
jgi:type IV pilus assembly protein PilC